MRALRLRMNALEARHTDDIDAPVAAILEPQNLDAPDQRVLDDEMQLPADQLVGALRLEPRRKPNLAVLGVVGDPRLQRRIIGAADGNASHLELGHGGEIDRKSAVEGTGG